MTNLREKFTENAEQFDALMVEMLAENTRLEEHISMLEGQLRAVAKVTDKLGIIGMALLKSLTG